MSYNCCSRHLLLPNYHLLLIIPLFHLVADLRHKLLYIRSHIPVFLLLSEVALLTHAIYSPKHTSTKSFRLILFISPSHFSCLHCFLGQSAHRMAARIFNFCLFFPYLGYWKSFRLSASSIFDYLLRKLLFHVSNNFLHNFYQLFLYFCFFDFLSPLFFSFYCNPDIYDFYIMAKRKQLQIFSTTVAQFF